MILHEQAIGGVFEIEPEPARDKRGFFARTFDAAGFAERGLTLAVAEASISFNSKRGTLRGLHLQVTPHEEAKLVRCLSGAVFDVVVDLRAGSPTQLDWLALELSAVRRNAVYVPPGCAHGFMTLEDSCELEYLISTPYAPAAAAGVHWDDPSVGIEWPSEPVVISPRDAAFPALDATRIHREGPSALAAANERSS